MRGYRILGAVLLAVSIMACGNENLDIVGTDTRFLRLNQLLTLNTDSASFENFQFDSIATGSTASLPTVIVGIRQLPDGKELRAIGRIKFSYPLSRLDSSFDGRPGAILRVLEVSLITRQVRAQADTLPSLAPLEVEVFRSPTIWKGGNLFNNTPFIEQERLADIRWLKGDSLATETPLPCWYGDSLLAAARRGQKFLEDSTTLTLSFVPKRGNAVITLNGLLTFLRLTFDLRTPTGIERRSVLMNAYDAGYTGSKNFVSFDQTGIFLSPTIGARAVLRFNLPMLRPGTIVTRAELILHRDTLYTPIDAGDYQVGVALSTADRRASTSLPEQRMVITNRSRYSAIVTGDVQEWANQPASNFGFLLRSISPSVPATEAGSISPIRFFGNLAADSLRPRLIVTYVMSSF